MELSWEPLCEPIFFFFLFFFFFFLCISALRSGPRAKLASRESALNPPMVYSMVVSMLVQKNELNALRECNFVLFYINLRLVFKGQQSHRWKHHSVSQTFTTAGVRCRVAAVKRLLVLKHRVDDIFCSFDIISNHWVHMVCMN